MSVTTPVEIDGVSSRDRISPASAEDVAPASDETQAGDIAAAWIGDTCREVESFNLLPGLYQTAFVTMIAGRQPPNWPLQWMWVGACSCNEFSGQDKSCRHRQANRSGEQELPPTPALAQDARVQGWRRAGHLPFLEQFAKLRIVNWFHTLFLLSPAEAPASCSDVPA